MISHYAVLLCSENPLTCVLEEYQSVPATDQYRIAQFGISDVRSLIQHAYRRPDDDSEKRTIIVATEFVTEEAQQALLKIIEEPPLSTAFVFVIPEGYTFLPTLESRFERAATATATTLTPAFEEFKDAPYAERMAKIEQATKQKNHDWQAEVKRGLVTYLKTQATSLPKQELSELEYVTRYLLTRGASNKFLLEHLALSLSA
jgi:DNA polymerase III delta prime subunit